MLKLSDAWGTIKVQFQLVNIFGQKVRIFNGIAPLFKKGVLNISSKLIGFFKTLKMLAYDGFIRRRNIFLQVVQWCHNLVNIENIAEKSSNH